MAPMSMWLVGSSRISTSGFASRAAARATRFLCPPESSPTFCAGSSSPSTEITILASETISHAPSASMRVLACSSCAALPEAPSSRACWASAASYATTACPIGVSALMTASRTDMDRSRSGSWAR
mmetsp:Transcript_35777/g.113014  ORF Transcript_35777/g.113014 Transcript_35777/m.113014 type:complete len:125 (+) Transcript_35777:636-1010(+)